MRLLLTHCDSQKDNEAEARRVYLLGTSHPSLISYQKQLQRRAHEQDMRVCCNFSCDESAPAAVIFHINTRTRSLTSFAANAVAGRGIGEPLFYCKQNMRGLPAAAMPGNKQIQSILPLPIFQPQVLLPMMQIRLCPPEQHHESGIVF